MERIKAKFALDEQQLLSREKTIARLQKDPRVLAFLSRHDLDPSILREYSSLFSRWLKNREACAICTGLPFCVMKVKGQQPDLEVDEDGCLNEIYHPCEFEQKKRTQRAHERNFVFAHLHPEDYLINFAWISSQPAFPSETRDYFACYSDAMNSTHQPNGRLFFGQPGTGKTTLMLAAANQHAQEGKRVAFVRVPLLMAEIKENLKDEEWRRGVLSLLRSADVLFLDDFGSESATAWTRDEILFPVLDERMNAGRKTYFASNLSPQELERRYTFGSEGFASVPAKRLMERVWTLAKPAELKGLSRRTKA